MELSAAQDPKLSTPQPGHEILKRFEGEWRFEKLIEAADGSRIDTLGAGEITAEMVGGFFVVSKWSGNVYGGPYTAVQTVGYDAEKQAYVGIWIDNTMGYQWPLHGSLAADSKELIIASSGPGPAGGICHFRERYQFKSADLVTIIAEMMQEEKWVEFMTTQLTRKPTLKGESIMRIHYLETVCRDVAAQCAALERVHGLSFGPAVADLGGARVAKAADGSLIGVRAPLAEHEQPIIRTYLEVDDIAKAIREAEAAGGVVAYPPTKQGETGTWAIYFLGDVQFGLWQQ
jgi:predicted enzyme related to lactoylglutathione lyase